MKSYISKFGAEIKVGQECLLCNKFHQKEELHTIHEFTKSGKWFRIKSVKTGQIHPNIFSSENHTCKGSHLGNTYISFKVKK